MKINLTRTKTIPILFDTILMLSFIAGVQIPVVSIAAGIVGYIVCLFFIIRKDMCTAYRFYMIFLTTSIEVSYFATGVRDGQIIYSFIVLPYFTIYTLFGLNLLMFLIIRSSGWHRNVKNCEFKGIRFIYQAINYMMIVGMLMWLITYLLNDNGIFGESWFHTMTISEVYRMSVLYFTVHNGLALLLTFDDFHERIGSTIRNLLFALLPTGLIAVFWGVSGYRAGQSNLLMLPLYAFFAFCLFAFPQYRQFKGNKIITYIVAIGLFILMIFRPTPLGGKWFLSIILVLAIIVYTSSPIRGFILLGVGIIAFVFVLQSDFIYRIFGNNAYMLLKYNEASEIISSLFGRSETIISGSSSSFRVDEFINIIYEYLAKPWYAIFGKGIVGTTLHHTSSLSWAGAGSFSAVQQQAGVYVRVHESINLIFLKYGIVGLYGMTRIVVYGIKSMKKSPWAIIGILWLLFYVGVYQTLLIGAMALILGVYESYLDESYSLRDRKIEKINNA